MSSKYLIFSGDFPEQTPENLTYQFNPPIDSKYDLEVAIIDGSFVSSNSNISEKLGNNIIRYSHNAGVTWFDVIFPPGIYAVSDISNELHKIMKANDHFTDNAGIETYDININIVLHLLRVSIEILGTYRIDLSQSKIWDIMGFNNQIYLPGLNIATKVAKIGDSQRYYIIQMNIIDSGITASARLKNGVAKIIQNQKFGSGVVLKEADTNYIDYFRCSSRIISSVTIRLLDIYGTQIDTNGEKTGYVLHFRRLREE